MTTTETTDFALRVADIWTVIQSTIRRAAQIAWNTSPEHVQQLAGYPLTGTPSAVQFLVMLYNALVRRG